MKTRGTFAILAGFMMLFGAGKWGWGLYHVLKIAWIFR